jgi:superfamily II DNA or RNA helicase
MQIALRDYQLECLETVLNESKAGVSRQLLSLPTGSGKTICMAAIAKAVNKKTLLLAHREELITQAVDKFKLFWPGVSVGVCMADRNELQHQIVVGSVQSCSRPKRLEKLQREGFAVMMIDEAHHSTANSYQDVINALGFSKGTSKLLLGVTATPSRGDKQPLGDTFDKITFSRSIGTMIKAGYLSPVIGRKILTSFVLDRIRTQNGDFSISELSEAVNTPERNAFIVEKFKTYAEGRKGVAFCCDVQHCQDLTEAFNKQGIAAAAVWGDMQAEDRKQVLDDLKSGRIQVAASCGILCEGYDEPSINAVIMARPTKSASLYIQCVGRGLRLWPGKQNCLVLDFSDKGHNLDSIISLSSTIPEAAIIKGSKEERGEREEIDNRPKIEVLEEVDREFDILGNARFMWVPVGDEWSLLDDEKREIVMSPSGGGFIAALHKPNGEIRQVVATPLPLEYCAGICEDFARRNLKLAFANLNASWTSHATAPTQGQRSYLERQNAWRDGLTKVEAAIEIRKIVAKKNKKRRQRTMEPITDKQRYALINYGVDPTHMSKFEALLAISKIKQEERARYA